MWVNTGDVLRAGFVFCARTGRPWLVSVSPELDTNQNSQYKVTDRVFGLGGEHGSRGLCLDRVGWAHGAFHPEQAIAAVF